MNLTPLPALADNYIWLLHHQGRALVVDPGEAQPVLDALQALGLQLDSILVTHHHGDHVGGVAELLQRFDAKVYGPAREQLPIPVTGVGAGDTVTALGLAWQVLDVPGHTAGHVAYYCPSIALPGGAQPVLFCGDTLFSGGCGRLFEGTPAQMLDSLDSLAALPGATHVCCTHEYTLGNLRFARAVEPDNADLQAYDAHCQQLRAQGLPTLPSTIAQELRINPFLRTRAAPVIRAAAQCDPATAPDDAVAVFAAIRQWKNRF